MLTLDLNDLRSFVTKANQRQAMQGLHLLAELGLLPEPPALRQGPRCPLCGAPVIAGAPGLHRHCPAKGYQPPTPAHRSGRAHASAFHRDTRQKGRQT
jgi:hypothetical protein